MKLSMAERVQLQRAEEQTTHAAIRRDTDLERQHRAARAKSTRPAQTDRELRIVELNAAGKTDVEIADQLGITASAVQKARRRLALPSNYDQTKFRGPGHGFGGNPIPQERLDAVRKAHAEGLTDNLVAERLGIPEGKAYSARRKLGLPANGRGLAAGLPR